MTFSLSRILTNIRFILVLFFRDPQMVFLSLVFPALLFVILGSVFDTDIKTLFPGIAGICVMFAAMNWTIGAITRYRSNGVFYKLTTTPLTGFEWNLSWIVIGIVIVTMSTALSFLTAWLVFGFLPFIDMISLLTLLAGAFIFTGMGMTIAYLINDPDAAGSASYAMIIPLMLVSGSLFPVERLPSFLQFFSILSPLTYLNNCLRGAMNTGDLTVTVVNLIILAFFGLLVYCVGIAVLMGKEGHDV